MANDNQDYSLVISDPPLDGGGGTVDTPVEITGHELSATSSTITSVSKVKNSDSDAYYSFQINMNAYNQSGSQLASKSVSHTVSPGGSKSITFEMDHEVPSGTDVRVCVDLNAIEAIAGGPYQ